MTNNSTTLDSPILAKLRAALNNMYCETIERVVMYASSARGDARPDVYYDIAVFIKVTVTFTDDSERLATITIDILADTGAVISATPFPAGAYRERTGFMHELRKDGLDL